MTNMHRWLVTASAASLLAYAGTAAAQSAAPMDQGRAVAIVPDAQDEPRSESPDGLSDIVVTARKTTENNQKAPASIVAVDADELVERGVTDLQSIIKVLPSANLRTQGSIVQVFIRGIGTRTDLPNFSAASAFLYNGVVMPRSGTFGLLFDVERIESIAGPQGTLYGGSAAGGAVNLFSAVPAANFDGRGDIAYGSFDSVRVSAAQNFALSDALSARAAVQINRRDSYFGRDLDTVHVNSGRVALSYNPSSDLSVRLNYTHVLDTGEPNNSLIQIPFRNPADPYFIPATGTAGNPVTGAVTSQRNRSDILSANADFSFGDNDFSYIGGYVDFVTDIDRFSGTLGRLLLIDDAEKQFSQELRWNRVAGPFSLSAGLFYLHDEISYRTRQGVFTSPTASTTTQANRTQQTNKNSAIFGQVVYSISDAVRATAGGRVSRDSIDATGAGSGNVPINFRRSQTRGDYKLGFDFDLAPRVLLYANLQSGYIPFGYNPDIAPNALVQESQLTAYSGGFKSRLFDNKLELNVEGFYYVYKDFQAIQFISATATSTVLNAPKSTILGVDIGLRAELSPTTTINGGIVLERAKYDEFSGVGYNFDGNQLINAPDAKLQGGIEQRVPLGRAGELSARLDSLHSSSYFGSFNNFPNSRQPRFTKTDFTLTYRLPGDVFQVQAFVRNIEDTPVYTTLGPGATVAATGSSSLELPRNYGVRLAAKW